MNIAQKLGLTLGRTLLIISITFGVVGFLFINSLGKPETVKEWLRDSGLYSSLAEVAQQQFKENSTVPNDIPPELLDQAVKQTLDEQAAQEFIETNIDSSYAWLNDDQQNFALELDTQQLRQDFSDNLVAAAQKRLESLPQCAPGTMPSSNILNAPCLPAGITADQALARVRAELPTAADNDFIELPEDINAEQESVQTSQPPSAQPIKNAYQWVARLPLIAIVLFVLASALIVWLSQPRYKSLRTLATVTIPYGILYILAGLWLPNFLTTMAGAGIESIKEPAVHSPLQNLAEDIFQRMGKDLTTIGALLTILGAILLVAYIVIKKRNPPRLEPTPEHKPSTSNPDSSPTDLNANHQTE